jgi:hypothetical protein
MSNNRINKDQYNNLNEAIRSLGQGVVSQGGISQETGPCSADLLARCIKLMNWLLETMNDDSDVWLTYWRIYKRMGCLGCFPDDEDGDDGDDGSENEKTPVIPVIPSPRKSQGPSYFA